MCGTVVYHGPVPTPVEYRHVIVPDHFALSKEAKISVPESTKRYFTICYDTNNIE